MADEKEAARLLWAAWRLRQRWRDRAERQGYSATRRAVYPCGPLYGHTGRGDLRSRFDADDRPGYVDLDAGVFYRRAVGARETKKRQPPVRLPPGCSRICVAGNAAGCALRSVIEWNGQPSAAAQQGFPISPSSGRLRADVVPHTLRHTAITWQAQLGRPRHEICGFFGITPEMFDRVYGHHHPDHQANAVNALSRRPTISRQLSRNQT